MILAIDEKYRIKSDEYCWHIQKARTRTKDGKKVIDWESIKWVTSLESAVNILGELMVRTSDAQTLGEALIEIEKITTTLSQALTTKFKVIPVTNKEKADEYSCPRSIPMSSVSVIR